MAKCAECGKEFTPKESFHKTCFDCFKKSGPKSGGFNQVKLPGQLKTSNPAHRGSGSSRDPSTLDKDCYFSTFRDESGYYKRAIYIEAADNAASAFEAARMTQSSYRRLFQMLKQAELRLRTDKDFGAARQTFFEFVRQVEYQQKRDVIKEVFTEFIRRHTDVATHSPEEFRGFVEYLTSIMARMKQK